MLLNSKLHYNLFLQSNSFYRYLEDSATTWQNTNLKINFINFFIWFIRLSVKFFNNVR